VFRENLRSLKWVLLLVVFAFVVALFAVYGGGVTGGGGGSQSWVARVDGQPIPVPAVQERAGRLDNLYRQFYGAEQYQQLREGLDLFGFAMEQLIEEEILLAEADRQGIQVTNGELHDRIRQHPNLQENGRFIGRDRYLELARSGQFDARQFEERIGREILLEKITGLLMDGIQVSDSEVFAEYRRLNEKINADFITLAPAAIADRVEITEAEIEDSFRIRKEAYRRPERRQGSYIELLTMKVGEDIHPTDDEIYNYYQQNLTTKYTHQDQRRARHILFRVPPEADAAATGAIEEKARQVLDRIRAGEDFAGLAGEYGEDGTAARGGDLGYFGKGAMVPAFEQVVWALEVGEVGDLVRTQFGFHIVKLLDVQEYRVDSFEEMKDKIRNVVRFQMSLDETGRQLREMKASMGDIENFRTMAEQAGFTVKQTGLVSQSDPIEGLQASHLIVQQLFRLSPGEISEPFGSPNGQMLLVLEQTVPGELPELSEVRDRVEADVREEKASEWLQGRVEDQKGSEPAGQLTAFAADLGVEVRQAVDLARGTTLPDLPETLGLVEKMFDLSEGDWIGPESLGAGDMLLLQITGKTGLTEGFEAQRNSLYRSQLRLKQDAHLRSVLGRLKQDYRVERNAALLAQRQQP
jgi:peptidyl-prolyl cis-trans isomerase D